jgi:hypothetical protein
VRYELTPINTRPWLLNGLSLRLVESHYENHYGGALRRLNAITEQLESLDFRSASKTGSGNCRNPTRSWCSVRTDFMLGARRQSRYARPDSTRST